MEERRLLIEAMLRGEASVSALCREAGVSRKTAYKWLARYHAHGCDGLSERSRARLTQEEAASEELVGEILRVRAAHPTWGIKKILPYLARHEPDLELCSHSTGGRILRAAGKTRPTAKRRGKALHARSPRADPIEPNHIWTVDFKGQFRMGDGRLCYPLTVADAFSRFVIAVDGKLSTAMEPVQVSFRRLFAEHGLPRVIRSDNGSPFAGSGLGRLTRLSVWWLSLDIELDRITPGRPYENGRHERMHRTLKAETTRPPGKNLREQQEKFDRFVPEHNHERPHEALGQQVPASVYQRSANEYRGDRVEEDIYPGHWERRRVRPNGQIKWRGSLLFLSEPLSGQVVGLTEIDDGIWQVHYRKTLLGILDHRGSEPTVRAALMPAARPFGRGDEAPLPFQTIPSTPLRRPEEPTNPQTKVLPM